jgi:hypothetical protein
LETSLDHYLLSEGNRQLDRIKNKNYTKGRARATHNLMVLYSSTALHIHVRVILVINQAAHDHPWVNIVNHESLAKSLNHGGASITEHAVQSGVFILIFCKVTHSRLAAWTKVVEVIL